MLISWDERRTLIILPSKELIPFVLDHFFTLFEEAVEKKGSFQVALSGGSTPKQLYAAIPSHPKAKNAPWNKIFLYWGDERAVSPESAESNYKMALDAGLSQLPILKENIFRMKAENNIEAHAKEYEKILKENLGTHGLDLIFLGMGEDGHTASLFPGTKALLEKSRYVVANEVPEKKMLENDDDISFYQ